MPNRFEEVETPQPDAITLALHRKDGAAYGTVACPAAISGGRLPADVTSSEMPAVDAFRSAIRLANEIRAPVVVIDPDKTWDPKWGELYQEV